MATCKECKSYFEREDEPGQGDCVTRQVDPRQSYYGAKPVEPGKDATKCSSFQKK